MPARRRLFGSPTVESTNVTELKSSHLGQHLPLSLSPSESQGRRAPTPCKDAAALPRRHNPALGLVLHTFLIIGPQLGLRPYLGSWWFQFIIAAGALLVVRRLVLFRRWSDELCHVHRFLTALASLLAVLVIENFATWAVAASDQRKYSYTPLQDNARLLLDWAVAHWPSVAKVVLGWHVDMHWLLWIFLALCLSVLWDQVPHSGFAIGARFMDTIAWSHALRTLMFMTTVLPNPRPNCYARSFPAVPSDPWEFVRIGFSAKRGSGCNDLIFSGHSVVYAAVPLAVCSYYRAPGWAGRAGMLAWLAVAKLCIQETVERTHYSVDMFLGVAVTALVWHWRSGMYPASSVWHERPKGTPADPRPWVLVGLAAAVLALVLVGTRGV